MEVNLHDGEMLDLPQLGEKDVVACGLLQALTLEIVTEGERRRTPMLPTSPIS